MVSGFLLSVNNAMKIPMSPVTPMCKFVLGIHLGVKFLDYRMFESPTLKGINYQSI